MCCIETASQLGRTLAVSDTSGAIMQCLNKKIKSCPCANKQLECLFVSQTFEQTLALMVSAQRLKK